MRWAQLDETADIDAWEIRESDRHLYRGRITCPDNVCRVGLNWRKRSTDGKAPTFYGEHVDGCSYKIESDERIAERELEEVDAVVNTCDEMRIRLELPAGGRPRTEDTPGAIGGTRATHQHRGNDRTARAGSTGLRPLLRKLIRSPEFRVDQMPLTLSDGTHTTLSEGCQHVNEYRLTDATRIVWGKIKTTKVDWINSGFRTEMLPAVRISPDMVPNILEAVGVQSIRDLVGWYFLVEGQFRKTSAGGPYVSLRDASRIVFLPDPAASTR